MKIVVTCYSPGFRCAGRQFAAGDTELVLEDLPDLPVEVQLGQLDLAKGGPLQANGLDRGTIEGMYRAPALLTYRIVEDPPPAPPPEPEPEPLPPPDTGDDKPPDDPPPAS